MTVTDAAERLNLSRVQCHTLMNRAAAGVLEALLPKKPGRRGMPEREQKLQEEVETLRRENKRLEERVETIDRLMTVAGGILRGQVRTTRTKKKKTESGSNEPEDPDGAARRKIEEATRLRGAGVSAALAAALVGVCASTMRRWRQRVRANRRACHRRGPSGREELCAEKRTELEQLVRELRGLCGAAALGHAAGVSRRQAARVKRQVLVELERERVARCSRLLVTEPGVLRSLDQLYIGARPAQQIALIASDASTPYRTSARTVLAYTGEEVARVLEEDFTRNGAPLVLRMDRASSHDAPAVRDVLRAHEVLQLHGPARYPQYYGQHERQNREHNDWLAHAEKIDDAELAEMMRVLNERWLRPSLGWRSAAEVWERRTRLRTDRRQLRREVMQRTARLRARLGAKRQAVRLAERLAIEQALEDRGLVRRIPGGWC
jgi:transposase